MNDSQEIGEVVLIDSELELNLPSAPEPLEIDECLLLLANDEHHQSLLQFRNELFAIFAELKALFNLSAFVGSYNSAQKLFKSVDDKLINKVSFSMFGGTGTGKSCVVGMLCRQWLFPTSVTGLESETAFPYRISFDPDRDAARLRLVPWSASDLSDFLETLASTLFPSTPSSALDSYYSKSTLAEKEQFIAQVQTAEDKSKLELIFKFESAIEDGCPDRFLSQAKFNNWEPLPLGQAGVDRLREMGSSKTNQVNLDSSYWWLKEIEIALPLKNDDKFFASKKLLQIIDVPGAGSNLPEQTVLAEYHLGLARGVLAIVNFDNKVGINQGEVGLVALNDFESRVRDRYEKRAGVTFTRFDASGVALDTKLNDVQKLTKDLRLKSSNSFFVHGKAFEGFLKDGSALTDEFSAVTKRKLGDFIANNSGHPMIPQLSAYMADAGASYLEKFVFDNFVSDLRTSLVDECWRDLFDILSRLQKLVKDIATRGTEAENLKKRAKLQKEFVKLTCAGSETRAIWSLGWQNTLNEVNGLVQFEDAYEDYHGVTSKSALFKTTWKSCVRQLKNVLNDNLEASDKQYRELVEKQGVNPQKVQIALLVNHAFHNQQVPTPKSFDKFLRVLARKAHQVFRRVANKVIYDACKELRDEIDQLSTPATPSTGSKVILQKLEKSLQDLEKQYGS